MNKSILLLMKVVGTGLEGREDNIAKFHLVLIIMLLISVRGISTGGI